MERRRRYYARFGLPIDGGWVPSSGRGAYSGEGAPVAKRQGRRSKVKLNPVPVWGVPGPFRDVPKRVGAAQWDFSLSYLSHLLNQALGTPPEKAQAASSPAMTSSSFWLKVGQTKLCLE